MNTFYLKELHAPSGKAASTLFLHFLNVLIIYIKLLLEGN